ncbi:MAG: lysine-sensitive aspartokinase 3 [Spirochaetota bacterium]
MIVLKFGGTSVQSSEWMDKTIDISLKFILKAPVVVSSAMSTVTDKLVAISQSAAGGDISKASTLVQEIRLLHEKTAQEFLSGEYLAKALSALDEYVKEMTSLVKGLSLLKECTPRSSDALLSFGELLSTTLLASRAMERGIKTQLLDARHFMITTDEFTSASPIFEITDKEIRNQVKPEPGLLIITQGFIGRTQTGATTTLGRGGSDYSATIIGAALDALEVQIWTDVDGIMTTDPRIVPGARTIERISYEEAAELAYFGAKVVHPSTIQPAVKKQIPVLVKNTRNPEGVYTAITSQVEGKGLRAIAGKKNISLINVTSSRMLNAYGFLNRIFSIFEKYKTAVDLIATSEVSVSMTIDNIQSIGLIVNELEKIGTVTVEHGKSIICLVGQSFWKDPSFIAQVFTAMNTIPVRMISLGSSDINLSLVVPGEMLDRALQHLHDYFLKPSN